MISVERLSKKYGEHQAVSDLSFSVEAGEILGLVGPNGAGKTTTLRMIAGIHPPTAGRASVAGRDIVSDPIEAKRKLALVPDQPELFLSLSVWEHLEIMAGLYEVEHWESIAEPLLVEMEIADRRNTLAAELSRGMRQKVMLACALLHRPKVLMLDEPLVGLDPRGMRTLFAAIERRAAEGSAVILSSHLLSQVEQLCSRFLILKQGIRLLEGTKEQIAAELADGRDDKSLEQLFFDATESTNPTL